MLRESAYPDPGPAYANERRNWRTEDDLIERVRGYRERLQAIVVEAEKAGDLNTTAKDAGLCFRDTLRDNLSGEALEAMKDE